MRRLRSRATSPSLAPAASSQVQPPPPHRQNQGIGDKSCAAVLASQLSLAGLAEPADNVTHTKLPLAHASIGSCAAFSLAFDMLHASLHA